LVGIYKNQEILYGGFFFKVMPPKEDPYMTIDQPTNKKEDSLSINLDKFFVHGKGEARNKASKVRMENYPRRTILVNFDDGRIDTRTPTRYAKSVIGALFDRIPGAYAIYVKPDGYYYSIDLLEQKIVKYNGPPIS